jgi:CHORD
MKGFFVKQMLTMTPGWKCCKPRVLTFDEFLEIPPCTTGKHSTVDDTPKPDPPPAPSEDNLPAPPPTKPISSTAINGILSAQPAAAAPPPTRSPAPPPESESDDPSLEILPNASCRRRGCNAAYDPSVDRSDEECVYHPGQALFHEGSKGWTCCKRRVLEFEEFMKIEGCKKKKRHLFIGKGKVEGEEELDTVR